MWVYHSNYQGTKFIIAVVSIPFMICYIIPCLTSVIDGF
jgi:hypothetical protein